MRVALAPYYPPAKVWHFLLSLGFLSLVLSACQTFGTERVFFDQQGAQVGLQADPSAQRASPSALNAHPAHLTDQELLVLLGALRVSGWSGTVMGWFDAPRSIPVFDEADLRVIVRPISDALRQATPTQRVFFSLPNPTSAYGDATAGALFIRGAYLHLVLTDHKAFARADTAGGDEKDLRDTKGMKLGVAHPYRTAGLTASDEPEWAPFETVHLSLNMKELLAQEGLNRSGALTKTRSHPSSAETTSVVTAEPTESAQDLRLQIRALTQSNLDLRDRLNQQTQQLQDLKEELTKLRRDSDGLRTKKPRTGKPSTP